MDAPIAYYTITSSKGDVKKVNSWRDLNVTVSGLRSSTTYTFTITATSADGTSLISASSLSVTTQVYVAPVAAATTAPLAAPAFTLTSIAETRTVDTTSTGFTISSTGGTIASFGISATPSGMSFNTTTGALSGTPNTVASATTYTITATNASGTATRTFVLTVAVAAVVYSVGDMGPGGGRIFHVASTPFACGPTRSATCTYLEAAPALWNEGGADPTRRWAQNSSPRYDNVTVNNASSPETATATAIGWGYRNTLAIILQGNSVTTTSAAALADAYAIATSSVVYDDWYLPSKDELNQMCKWQRGITGADLTNLTTVCTGGTLNGGSGAAGFVLNDVYWSSSEKTASAAWEQDFSFGFQNAFYKDFTSPKHIRPIRAF